MRKILLLLSIICPVVFSCKKTPQEPLLMAFTPHTQHDSIDNLKMNEIQVVGSHNSYRMRTYAPIFELVMMFYEAGVLPAGLSPEGWDYDHVSLPEQFGAYGMRAIELDIYEDLQGGRFYNYGGLSFLGESVASGVQELNQPGFKVLHVPDFDYRTHYYSFRSALQAVKLWSNQNPNHLPIFIQVESKTETVGDQITFADLVTSQPYSSGASDALDNEIKSVFGEDLEQVITPDDVRGNYPTLREAVLDGNWPTLAQARGKVVFAMEGALVSQYVQGHPSLQGRAMFTFANPSAAHAAFVILNNPVGQMSAIQQAVAQGFIVRTRADSDTREARTGDYTTMNAAFSGGAQIISTDYYRPDLRHKTDAGWTDYKVAFPGGGTFRINPVSAAEKVHYGAIVE